MRIGSYNVLADAYLRRERYPRVDAAMFDRERRRAGLIARILGLDADVVCLQEVADDACAAFESALRAHGYAGVHARRRGHPDGCATFVRGLRWRAEPAVYYDDGLDGAAPSGHCALVTHVGEAPREIGIVNTHLRWEPDTRIGRAHVGVRQAAQLRRIAADGRRWLLCGDFNATPDSEVLVELTGHGLVDAGRGTAGPTFNATGTARRIDFVLHTPDLRVVVDPTPMLDDARPLPAPGEPSDHLPVLATVHS